MRCSDERGIALVLVLIIMFSFSIMLVTVISYSDSTQTASYTGGARDKSSALAEAGLNDAFSVISQSGTDTTAIALTPTINASTGVTSGGTQVSFPGGGLETWGGAYAPATKTWTITSYGSYPNPNGTATRVWRRLGAAVQIVAPPYSFASLDSGCDKHALIITLGGQLTVTNGIYVNSCDNGHDAFDVKGSGGSISAPSINVVGGWETASGNLVKVNGATCPLGNDNPPDPTPPTGCPTVGAPVITDPYASKLTAPTPGAPACTATVYGAAVSYTGKPKLSAAITAAQTTLTLGLIGPANGDVIVVESEDMLVTGGGGTTSLTVQRAYNGTTAAAHGSGKEAKQLPVTGTQGTAALPGPCDIYSGTVTLNPGTYYGGICIGAQSGHDCGSNIGGTCTTTSSATANVTMTTGTYIMAGGGFFVCGSSTLSAPNVLIYNTQDASQTAGSGAIDQILLNTTGAVTLGPPATGSYQGLTIFQDRSLAVAPATSCDSKKSTVSSQDIAFESMASTGPNGSLGSVSGTIYAPGPLSDFADYLSGTGNLAILTTCLVISGGDATFNFQPQGLFGTGDSMKVLTQW